MGEEVKAKLEELGATPIQQLRIKINSEGARYCFAEYANIPDTAQALRNLKTSSWRGCDLRPELAMTQEGGGMQEQSRTLYLKNIDPGLTEEKMKQMFSKFGELVRCTIPKTAEVLANYAFVEFVEPSAAEDAYRAVQEDEVFAENRVHVEFSRQNPTRRRRRFSGSRQSSQKPAFPCDAELRKHLSFIPAFDRWTGRYVLLAPKSFKSD